jgi:F-box/leucine-rich repeat protein 4
MKDLSHDIRVLDLSWTKFKSNEILNDFFKISCHNLTVLKLDNCNFINGRMVSFISTNCESIKELSLSSCNFKDVDGLCDIKNLTSLVNLNLYRTLIQIEQLEQILISCTKLRHLNLGSCIEIKDFDSIMYLISKNLPNIESLDLWRAYSLSHDSLNKIANSCFNLQYLDIGWW